jgi:hypothetical protein
VSTSHQCSCTCSFSLPFLVYPTVAVNMPGTDQEMVLKPYRSSTVASNLQTDNDHKSSSMLLIAHACRLCAPAYRPSQRQTSSSMATVSNHAALRNCAYANVRQLCCHGTLSPSRVGFMQLAESKVTCFQSCSSYGHSKESSLLARYLTCAL